VVDPNRQMLRIRLSDPLYADVLGWLIDEARQLDGFDLEGWLGRLAPDLRYSVPVSETAERATAAPQAAPRNSYLEETFDSLELRVRRLLLASAWVENPRTRTRRFVSNVLVEDRGELVRATSYLLFCAAGATRRPMRSSRVNGRTICAGEERNDFELVRREVRIDQAVLGLSTLSFLL